MAGDTNWNILHLPRKVVSGRGSFSKLSELIRSDAAQKILIITDKTIEGLGHSGRLKDSLVNEGYTAQVFSDIKAEPTVALIKTVCANDDYMGADLILAVGGGSVIDTAKITAAAAKNPEFRQNPTDGGLIRAKGLTLVAVPTTAGTGAEATPNAILLDEEAKTKLGVVSPLMIPDLVVLDCTLTESLPKHVAVSTGLDALAHALESYLSKKANGLTDMFGLEAMRLIFGNLAQACEGNNPEARQNMLTASFYAGVCLAGASTHIVHAMAYPLSGEYHVPHGVGIAALLPPVIEKLQDACSARLCEAAESLWHKSFECEKEGAALFVNALKDLAKRLEAVYSIAKYGVMEDRLLEMALDARKNERLFLQAPVDMDAETLASIYRQIL